MLHPSDGLAAVSCVTGLIGAAYWWRSSRVQVNSSWAVEPGDESRSQAGWIAATLQALADAGRLNKHAAIWTGISVAAMGLGTLAGRIGA
jgi:hypothetical protein